MGALQLNNIERPDFNLPEEYKADVWNITEWEIYTHATDDQQKYWKLRSGKPNYAFDFSVCQNVTIREELKYCMYIAITSGIGVRTFAEKYSYVKHYFNFYNDHQYGSIKDTDLSDFEKYLSKAGLKKKTQNGTRAYSTKGVIQKETKTNRVAAYLTTCIRLIDDFLMENIDIDKRDIWKATDFPILDENIDGIRRIDFSVIPNEEFKSQLKAVCKHRISVITFIATGNFARCVMTFMCWMGDIHPETEHLSQLNRSIMEEYFIWLRTESGMTSYSINIRIANLKQFFEFASLLELPNIPDYSLILSNDFAFKTKKESHFFTDSEIQSIIKVIPKMEKLYGRILYCLLTLGCRVSEVMYLKTDSIKQYPDQKYYLVLHQFKTHADYEKPIPDSTAKIILSEIANNKKRFGDEIEYVFLNDKKKTVSFATLTNNITRTLLENNVLDRNGKPLKCNTHRFRSTLATSLLKSGYDVETTGKLLGQKSLASLAYYAAVTNEDTKEQLKERIAKDELLISNIGKFDENVLSDYEAPIALCNGYCVKPHEMGLCSKANHCLECEMFIPTLSYLSQYERQLREVEASIEVAKANNMDLLLEKNLKTKNTLETIISKIRKRRDTNE